MAPFDPPSPARRRLLQGVLAVAVGGATASAADGYFYERHRITLTRAGLRVSGLPETFRGIRVALLTDLHYSRTVPADDIAEAVRLTMAERPDLVILGGDYVTWGDRRYVGGVADLIGPLTAPLGVFAILGNHDDDRDLPAALTRRGVTVLRDARTVIRRGGDVLDLVGIRYWTRRVGDIARLLRPGAECTALLAHDPRRLVEAAQLGIPLVLSGHTHGGQVVLPGIGALAARKFPIVAGEGMRDGTRIYVSRGIGTVYVPIRINCPPEVSILTLDRATA